VGFLKRIHGEEKKAQPAASGQSGEAHPAHVHDPEIERHAPGWLAIDRAADALYHAEPPFHIGTKVRWGMGGPDPLDGVSVYVNEGPPDHWHYVTYGLSELYEKESEDAEVSGWGLEFTLRVARGADTTAPPNWAWSFLQNLARYTFETGDIFWPNHTLNLNGPIALGSDTAIRAAAFTEDPQLGTIQTPNGRVDFVQIVGLTLDEYRAMKDWSTEGVLQALREANPMLVTDLARHSVLDNPETARVVRERIAAEGSSMNGLRTAETSWGQASGVVRITTGAIVVEGLVDLLNGRCAVGREAIVWGPAGSIQFIPGEAFGWHVVPNDPTVLHIEVPPAAARDLAAAIRPVAGEYSVPSMPTLIVTIQESVIRDQNGAEVERIG